MLSANKSPQIINVRLSNPYIDTSKPFRDPYLLFESLTSMSHTDIRILYVNLTSQNERCNALLLLMKQETRKKLNKWMILLYFAISC